MSLDILGIPIYCAQTAAVDLLMIREGLSVLWSGLTMQGLGVAVYGVPDTVFTDGWWSLVMERDDGTACVMRDGRSFAYGAGGDE